MNFVDAVKSGFQKYGFTAGRSSRSEYFYWHLFLVLALFFAKITDNLLQNMHMNNADFVRPISSIMMWVLIIPSITVCIRRLHDIDWKGAWWLLVFIPFIGGFVLLYLMCQEGTKVENRFGPPPIS